MTTGFVLFSVRIPYQFLNSLCCGVGNTPKLQYVLKFVVSLFFCVGCIYPKKHQNIHRRSPTKYLAGVRVDSCCFYTAHIFVGDVFNHHAALATSCWGWSSPGTRPMCKAAFLQLAYGQGRVHPQSKDSWKSFMFGVNDEFELNHGFLNDHGYHSRYILKREWQQESSVFQYFPWISRYICDCTTRVMCARAQQNC